MTTKIWLEGDPSDLEVLAELFALGGTQVIREGDGYYLTSVDIDNPPEGEAPYTVATRLIPRINGLAAVHRNDFQPVSLGGEQTEGASGIVHHAAVTLEIGVRLSATATVVRADGTVVPDEPSPVPGGLALAPAHPDLDEVLNIMVRQPLGWPDLFNVFEIVRNAIKPREVHELMGVPRKAVGRFTGSAQQDRHARPTGVPENPMSPREGRDFASQLIIEWMKLLGA